jgi:hypothetical protein
MDEKYEELLKRLEDGPEFKPIPLTDRRKHIAMLERIDRLAPGEMKGYSWELLRDALFWAVWESEFWPHNFKTVRALRKISKANCCMKYENIISAYKREMSIGEFV